MEIDKLVIGVCALGALVVLAAVCQYLVFWLLSEKTDPNILQNKKYSSGGNLRLYDGGYSGTHEKFEAKKNGAVPEVRDNEEL